MLRYVLAIVLLGILFYGAVEAWPLVVGPTLAITSPVQYGAYEGGIVDVSGVAKRAAELTINGLPALHDADGDFRTTLTLPQGGSILTLRATDRFGRSVSMTRDIFVP